MSPRSKSEHTEQARIDEINARRLIEKGQLKSKAKLSKSLSWSDHLGEALERIREISPRPESTMFTTLVSAYADTVSYMSSVGNLSPCLNSEGDTTPRLSAGGDATPRLSATGDVSSPRATSSGGGSETRLSNDVNLYSEYVNLFEHLR
jgi:hypothetical protein